ncbi:caspase family protein [Nocardia sp. NPDC058499]|uniref:caspase family protein n=1 Tax=Nocardia sp. NPDC058499 TaxID=3346530 RepID=UPI00365BD937
MATEVEMGGTPMLRSPRFTTIVTHNTYERLLCADDNSQPIARGEVNRGAVAAIQSAIAALSGVYFSPAEVDGYFGQRTAESVESFQRDYGLIADGIIAHQTISQLDTLFSPDVVRRPHAVSIHLGLDEVDEDHYGSKLKLPSCSNDAKKMQEIAIAIGYDPVLLVNEDATTSNFSGFLRSCAGNLFADDCLFISFSGHGSQIPNTSNDFEEDELDETLCFFDRMLIDDELHTLLADLRAGVRVHVVFDSCHSETALKEVRIDPNQNKKLYAIEAAKGLRNTEASLSANVPPMDPNVPGGEDRPQKTEVEDLIPYTAATIGDAISGDREPQHVELAAPDEKEVKNTSALFADLYIEAVSGDAKFIDGSQIYDSNRRLYDTVKSVTGSKEDIQLACTAISLSACLDLQTTPAGNPLSLFTYNIARAWNNGAFRGSYKQFLRALRNSSPQASTPQLKVYGTASEAARINERPLMF